MVEYTGVWIEANPPPAASALRDEACGQLRRYLAGAGLRTRHPTVRFIGLALVFHGWELVACEAVEADASGQAGVQESPWAADE